MRLLALIFFRNVETLKSALEYQRKNEIKMNGEYYTSLTIEALLKMNPLAFVNVYEIESFYQWGTPQDLKDFEYWEKTFSSLKKQIHHSPTCEQILMPMAGKGSRLSQLLKVPKPLVTIADQPMYRMALNSFPKARHHVFVALGSFAKELELDLHETVVILEETPEGQALSTEAGLKNIRPGQDFIVTACDHSVVLNAEVWQNFIKDPQCDAAIFTMRGVPATRRKPLSFSYVKASGVDGFKLIEAISVKKPLTDSPSEEALLVGSFWFKDKSLAQKGIDLLKEKNLRVGGELYLDSIFSLLIEKGFKVRQIELDGYINWGDSESLKESLYWYEVFMGHKLSQRPAYPGCKDEKI